MQCYRNQKTICRDGRGRKGKTIIIFSIFAPSIWLYDAQRTVEARGVEPSELAPDFEIRRVGGAMVRLSDLHGKPTILHLGSYSCPITAGSVEPLKKLYKNWNSEVHFVDVLIRQAYPGPGAQPYRSFAEKRHDGERFRDEDGILYPFWLTICRERPIKFTAGLPTRLIWLTLTRRVAFYNMWTHAPTLHEAIEEFLAQNGRELVLGVVEAGEPFGELCFCAPKKQFSRGNYARATLKNEVLEIKLNDFMSSLQTSRERLQSFTFTFCCRLSNCQRGAEESLGRVLPHVAATRGKPSDTVSGQTVLPVSHDELAQQGIFLISSLIEPPTSWVMIILQLVFRFSLL